MRSFRFPGARAFALSAAALLVFAVPLAAQSLPAPLSGLSSTAQARLINSEELAQGVAEAGARLRVIVSFDLPQLPAGMLSGTADADEATMRAVRAGQEAILGRVLAAGSGQPALDGVISGALSGQASADDPLSLRLMTYSGAFALNVDAELLRSLAEDPQVRSIQIDGFARPLLNNYSLTQIQMPEARAAGATGTGTVVAVLDSGARSTHEFLSSRIVAGACFSSNITASNYTSTSLCPGGTTRGTTIASSNDCAASISGCGHGTHVSGIVAGSFPNVLGRPTMGVAPQAQILSIQVFSRVVYQAICGSAPCALSFDSDQIAALEYVYGLRNTYPIAAVNMSLGGGQFFSPCTSDTRRPIIQQLTNAGIAVVIAAGNDNFNTSVSTPACVPEAITVASTNSSDTRSVFSGGYGSNWGNQIDLAAPGSLINSSIMTNNSSYGSMSGTSMAAPHVAGAFAALRSASPTSTVAQMLSALQLSGTNVTSNGHTVPRINVNSALTMLRSTEARITTLELQQSQENALVNSTVTFTARVVPASGSGPVTGQVSFSVAGSVIGTAPLSGGTAVLNTSFATAGARLVTASFAGNANFRASSASVTHTSFRPAPVNDNFANRITIAAPGTLTGSNLDATVQTGEPEIHPDIAPRSTVWWSYTPSRDGTVSVSTSGSNFDTVLGAFTGTAVNALTRIASNDDAAPPQLHSAISFEARAGTSYHIVVGGYGPEAGSITLALGFTPSSTGPDYTPSLTFTGPATAVQHQLIRLNTRVQSPLGTPRGLVAFMLNGVEIGRQTVDSNGAIQLQYLVTATGQHNFTASYLGQAPFLAANSGTVVTQVAANSHNGIFVGGGVLWGFFGTCADAGWTDSAVPVRLRYVAGEIVGQPSQLSIIMPGGAEYVSTWEHFRPELGFQAASGRQIWRDVRFYSNTTIPRITTDTRDFLLPVGATTIETATELRLRLRVRNFSTTPDCTVRVSASLRREGQ